MTQKVNLDHAHMRHLLKAMIRIRRFEAKCVELYQARKILGFLYLYDGEEAVSVGVMEALSPDAIVATYREHGQALAFLECQTYRFSAHSMFDPQLYRSKEEVEAWRKKGPIVRFQTCLGASRLIKPEEVSAMETEVDAEIAAAVAFAEAGVLEAVSEVERFVTMEEVPA